MSKAKPKRTWRDKLADSKDLPKVAKIDAKQSKRWGTGTFVIPAPLKVDELMKTIRRGKVTHDRCFAGRLLRSTARRSPAR